MAMFVICFYYILICPLVTNPLIEMLEFLQMSSHNDHNEILSVTFLWVGII